MKYLLILLLSLAGCSKQEELVPKFHYGDWVEINEPFFGKCIGQVIDYEFKYFNGTFIRYQLNYKTMKCDKGDVFSRIYTNENQLIFIKSGEENAKE